NIRVVEYEATVEICEAEEGLDVLHLAWFRPIANSGDFVLRHCQAVGGEEVSEVFHQVRMKLTLFRFSKELVMAQAPKHFPNVFDMVLHIVYYHTDIKHICEDRVDKSLEGSQGIGEAERHHLPFIGAVASAEGGFPLITLGDVNQMVRMPKIDFSIDLRLTQGVKEVRNEG
ncbi:hypothetical protein SCLCIDRAFT_133116, partial [Scleroderma citrinum Foug A]